MGGEDKGVPNIRSEKAAEILVNFVTGRTFYFPPLQLESFQFSKWQ